MPVFRPGLLTRPLLKNWNHCFTCLSHTVQLGYAAQSMRRSSKSIFSARIQTVGEVDFLVSGSFLTFRHPKPPDKDKPWVQDS
jgi:hypothetical protein